MVSNRITLVVDLFSFWKAARILWIMFIEVNTLLMFHILLSYKWQKGIFNMANFVFVGCAYNSYNIET